MKLLLFLFLTVPSVVHPFVPLGFGLGLNKVTTQRQPGQQLIKQQPPHLLFAASQQQQQQDDDDIDDAELLASVPISQYVDLCLHLNLPAEGTKEDLLQRLRSHADEQAALDRQRKLNRVKSVDQGVGDGGSKEKYELVGSDDEEEEASVEDEGFFYFNAPSEEKEVTTTTETAAAVKSETTAVKSETTAAKSETTAVKSESTTNKNKKKKKTKNQVITAPPPPTERNDQGERVVTVYSTSDTNDLTGTTRPGDSGGVLMEGEGSEPPAPWELGASQESSKVPVELQEATETVTELVRSLLLLSGAPAFVAEFTEGLQPLENTRLYTNIQPARDFTGFDPAMVPTDILMASSKSLRAGRGSVLQDILYDLELRAVGHDGMAGDDKTKGGGHYEQVNKVRAFLEGFRKAELRRIARETTTMLLDKVASEGIQGLDTMLSTMTKSQDDSGDAGELSDSLLDFLNDMAREQETRVGAVVRAVDTPNIPKEDVDDAFANLWNVTNDNGERIETLDPQDPKVRQAMEAEWNKNEELQKQQQQQQPPLPTTAPAQLLLLLKLLRDRIKAEAAFGSGDERGRNLRILAYCLSFTRAYDREKLLRREFQSSVERIDVFLELVVSSMEYAESASTQLRPSSGLLNRKLLGEIHDMSRKIRDETATSRT